MRGQLMLGEVHVGHRRRDTLVAQHALPGGQIRAAFQEVGGKRMAVLISILPMKGPQSPFSIITIRFTENTACSFVGYDGRRAIKALLSSVMKSREQSRAGG